VVKKIENKDDERIHVALKSLFRVFSEGTEKGIYPLFLREDIFTKKINLAEKTKYDGADWDPESAYLFSPDDPFHSNFRRKPEDFISTIANYRRRNRAESVEEGLKNLGKLIYFEITGYWEHNCPSIKLDGYIPIKSISWPMLKILLSNEEKPTIEKVETEIIKERRKIRNGARFINEIIEWINTEYRNSKMPRKGSEPYIFSREWTWLFDPTTCLINMNTPIYHGSDEAGFIHKVSLDKIEFNYKKAKENHGLERLKFMLENINRDIESIEDKVANRWYLKEVYE
jgi:hypothetical protein